MGLGAWVPATADAPCPVCGRPDWCSVSADGAVALCRREAAGGSHRIDRAGVDYWVHRLAPADAVAGERAAARGSGGAADQRCAAAAPGEKGCGVSPARPPMASPEVLDRAYRAVLGALSLCPEHHRDLERRGLSPGEISHRGYRSYAPTAADAVVAGASRVVPAAMFARVPGFWRAGAPAAGGATPGGMRFGSGSTGGLVVPVRDDQGRIAALKVRRNPTREGAPPPSGSKYIYVSSAHHPGGVGPGAPVHVPLLPLPQTPIRSPETVRITEGELKADVAYCLSGIRTIAVPGVGAWRSALPVLRALGARRVLLAFDADARRNPAVARALYALAWALHVETSVTVAVETWEERDGKGIDDLLAAGHQPTVVGGAAVLPYLTSQVPASVAAAVRLDGVEVAALVAAPQTLALARGEAVLGRRVDELRRWYSMRPSVVAADALVAGMSPEEVLGLLMAVRPGGRQSAEAVLRAAMRML